MRKWVAKCSAALLAVTLIGLVFTCAQLVLPTPAYSRQIASGFEDGGDPDGLDGAMSVTDEFGGLVSTPEVGAQDAVIVSDTRGTLDLPFGREPGLLRARTGHRESLLRLWFLMTSMVLAP